MRVIDDGIYFDMPEADYHATHALSSSVIREVLKNPTKYWFRSELNPNRKEVRKACLDDGKIYHTLYLEGLEKFNEQYIVIPEDLDRISKNTNKYKAWRSKYDADRIILERLKYDEIMVHREYVNQWITPHIFKDGCPEVSIFWTDNGVQKKCRIDYLKLGHLIDLKTYINPMDKNLDDFYQNYIWEHGVYIQLEYYERGLDFALRNNLEVHGTPEQKKFIQDNIEFLEQGGDLKSGIMFIDREYPNSDFIGFEEVEQLRALATKKIIKGEEIYRQYREQFGLTSAWLNFTCPITFKDNDFRQLFYESLK